MYSVVPATRSLLSRLPAWVPGGVLLTRPISGAGATPMLPKNGRSGITIPGDLGDDRFQRCLNLRVRHAGSRQAARAVGEQRIDVDDVARRDAQHRRGLRPVVAVGDALRRGLEAVRFAARRLRTQSGG